MWIFILIQLFEKMTLYNKFTKIKFFAFLFSMFLYFEGIACSCPPFRIYSAERIKSENEFIFIGTPIENLILDNGLRHFWNGENEGTEVRFRVEKVIKGKITSQFVAINQFIHGNCARFFQFGERYIIVGNEIKGFIPNYAKIFEYPYLRHAIIQQVLYDGIYSQKQLSTSEPEIVKYWNELAKAFRVMDTDACRTFTLNSQYASLFLD
ncbi:hypothetical protein [Algoriphagus zhangzhouensis]|uniref:Uncharacterized protein n=1 Tax=Algoriphagus zhangzhouensis TaxID=1073327 RepID=A0A1M7ZCK1_9BACT|nr:hypothetical protein [Algoriphagus zhangzhouensis]TDY45592.1 hypothetical protein A8938_2192 [Algoriphagus zhangzhouensis]SHO62607.1 hypothetical protein SAMN04488108_2190 [Algoriphagus zhangzhouensis]